MGRQFVVFMFRHTVISSPDAFAGSTMDGGIGEIPQLMQQMMSHLFCDLMAALNRESRIYSNIQLCMKPVPEPPHPYLGNVPYPRRMAYGVSDFPCDLLVHPVKHASKDGFAGFPYNLRMVMVAPLGVPTLFGRGPAGGWSRPIRR